MTSVAGVHARPRRDAPQPRPWRDAPQPRPRRDAPQPRPRRDAPQRVLYLDTAPTVGGSVVSLYELLKGLDRSRFEPLVVTYAAHEYVQRFRALGAEVLVWEDLGRAPDYRPAWAGPARQSLVARSLQRLSLRSRLCTRWGAALYHGLGFGLLLARRVWPRAQALRRVIVEKRVDLVHTNIRVGHDREGILAAHLAGVPCVCHVRHFERLGWFDRRLAGLAAGFLYISEAVQRSHIESGLSCVRGQVVYNGLDTSTFASAPIAAQARRSLGLPPDGPLVGIVGRLESWKGQDVFLRAMARVAEAVPRARGIVIGAPVPHEPGYKGELLALRDELGLTERVAFGEFRLDVPTVMSALDVLVLASISPEPFGRVLIEAMAAGKPVVATDAGAAREVVVDGVQGLLVPPKDAQALAQAVIHILTHPDLARSMGQEGRTRVEQRFGTRQYVDGVQAMYDEVLRPRLY